MVKAACLEVRDRGFEAHIGLEVSKKQTVSSSLTRKDSILRGTFVTEKWRARPQTTRARISNFVSGGQCHLIHLAIFRMFSWPSLAYMSTKGGLRPHSICFNIFYYSDQNM